MDENRIPMRKRPSDTLEQRVSGMERHNQLRRISSEDGKTYFDTTNNQFVIEISGVKIVEIGNTDGGDVGIIVRDTSGNVILEMTDVSQKISSANGRTTLDLATSKFKVNDGTTDRVLIGDLS